MHQNVEAKRFGPNFLTRSEPPRVSQKVGPKSVHVEIWHAALRWSLTILQLFVGASAQRVEESRADLTLERIRGRTRGS